MASIGDLVANLSLNSTPFTRGARNAQSSLGSLANSVSTSVGGMIGQFGAMLGVGSAVAGIGWGVKLAADAEQTQIAFEVMLGSADKAKTLLGDLKAYADKSPFDIAGVNEGAKRLLNYGIAAADVVPTMKMLGDVAAGDMNKFDALATAFGQMSATGRLMGQDLNQFINAGFNPLQEIAKETGESMAELKKRMEAGGVSADEVRRAFQRATSEGGRFFGMTERQAGTLAGRFSTMKDGIASALREVGQALITNLDLGGWVDYVTQSVTQIPMVFRNLGDILSITMIDWQLALEDMLPGVADVVQRIGIFFSTLWTALTGDFQNFIASVTAGFKELSNLVEAAKAGIGDNGRTWAGFMRDVGKDLGHGVADIHAAFDAATGLNTGGEESLIQAEMAAQKNGGLFAPNQAAFEQKLAAQPDAMKPGEDWVSKFGKKLNENIQQWENQSASGAATALQKRKDELLKGIGEREAGADVKRADLGKRGDELANAKAAATKPDTASAQAALRGTQEANRIFTRGMAVDNEAKKQTALLSQIEEHLKPKPHDITSGMDMPTLDLMLANF